MGMRLSTRLTVAMVGLVLLTAAAVGYLTDRNSSLFAGLVAVLGALVLAVMAHAFARMAEEARDKTAALLDSERMARGIIDTALDAFVQMDESGIVVDWNAQAQTGVRLAARRCDRKSSGRPDRAGTASLPP